MFDMLKKVIAFSMVLVLLVGLTACGQNNEEDIEKEVVIPTATITWWSLPVFAKQKGETESFEQRLISAFTEKYPEITVEHKALSEDTYKNDLQTAAKNGTLPDVYFGFPDDIAQLAIDEKMVDLTDIIFRAPTEEVEDDGESTSAESSESSESSSDVDSDVFVELVSNIPENILMAGTVDGGKTYTFHPISASAFVMAFNKEIVEKAGALDLLPMDGDRSWTVEQYKELLTKLKDGLAEETNIDTGALYYGSTTGVRGTKNLIASAGGVMFEKDGELTINSAEGVEGMNKIKEILDENLLINGVTMQSSTNLEAFLQGNLAHTILYSMDTELNYKSQKKDDFTTVFMPYPSPDGSSLLDYTLMGAGVFKNDDEDKVTAAKLFVDFMANDPGYRGSVAGHTGGYSVNRDYNSFLEDEYKYFSESLDLHAPYTIDSYQTDSAALEWIECLYQVMFNDAEDSSEQLENFVESVENGGSDTEQSTTEADETSETSAE